MRQTRSHAHTKGRAKVSRDIYNNRLKNIQTNDWFKPCVSQKRCLEHVKLITHSLIVKQDYNDSGKSIKIIKKN